MTARTTQGGIDSIHHWEPEEGPLRTFRIFLSGLPQPIIVDLPAGSAEALANLSCAVRFVAGFMTDPDEDGVCPGVAIQTNRIVCALEVYR